MADALVRSQSSPLASFLAPSTTLRWTAQQQIRSQVAGNKSMRRQFSSASPRNVNWSPITTSTPPPKKDSSDPNSSNPSSPGNQSIESLSQSLGWASRTSAPKILPSSDIEREKKFNGGDSASDLLGALGKAGQPRRAPSSPFASSSGFNTSRMMNPGNPGQRERDVNLKVMMDASKVHAPAPRTPMKLGPSTGRTVDIGTGNVDIGRGFALLNMSCARNKVMRDLSRQRFHERPGLKKKRLARERWRRKFMEGFKSALGRVRTLQRQGW